MINDIYDQIPNDDPQTYELLQSGKVVGVFQIETPLGRSYCKKLKPENIHHIAALTALLRPGPLQGTLDDGVSITQHYINRKNGIEPVESMHPLLDDILEDTYGLIVYQEQLLKIVDKLAGFSLVEQDMVRKASGKKDQQEMAKVMKMFKEKSLEKGLITEAEADKICDWLHKTARYSFNKSHSYYYGKLTYITAYLKAHDPLRFYRSWLADSIEGPDSSEEIAKLVEDSKHFNIDIHPPTFEIGNKNFWIENKKIYFGIENIKGIGEKQANQIIKEILKLEIPYTVMDIVFGLNILPSKLCLLFESGYFRKITPRRQSISYVIKQIFDNIDDKELEWIKQNYKNYDNVIEVLEGLIQYKQENPRLSKRIPKIESIIELIKKPTYDITDTTSSIVKHETQLLGVSITCSTVNSNYRSTHTIKEIENAKQFPKNVWIYVEIKELREYTLKKGNNKGKKMAFIKIADQDFSTDAVIFCDEWENLRKDSNFYVGSKMLVNLERGYSDGLIIKGYKI